MPKITWLGDAECRWNKVTFQPSVPIDIDDPYMVNKARNNPNFRVEDYDPFLDRPTQWREPATEADPADFPPIKRKRGRPPKVRINVDQ